MANTLDWAGQFRMNRKRRNQKAQDTATKKRGNRLKAVSNQKNEKKSSGKDGKKERNKGIAMVATGTGMEVGGSVVEGAGKGVKTVGKGAQREGRAMMRAGSAMSSTGAGALVGVPLVVAGGATVGVGTGAKAAGRGMEAGGKVTRKIGKKVRKDGLRKTRRGLASQVLERMGENSSGYGAKAATNRLLVLSWLTLIPSFGLSLGWINIHAFMHMLFPNVFGKLGEEWIPRLARVEGVTKPVGMVEKMALFLLDLLAIMVMLGAIVLIMMVIQMVFGVFSWLISWFM